MLMDVVKIAVPMFLSIVLVVFVLRFQLRKDEIKERTKIRLEAFAKMLPLRVAAYERAILYLDRIHPTSILRRADPNRISAQSLSQQVLTEIETEYDHNVVQQLYISEPAWRLLMAAKSETVQLINEATKKVGATATGFQLVECIIELGKERNSDLHPKAMAQLKKDISSFLGA